MVNLAYLTAPAEVIEQLSVTKEAQAQVSVWHVVDGLRGPKINQLVRLARHKTISEALAHALEIEAVKEASRVATNPYQDQDKKTKTVCGAEGHVRRWCPQNDSLLKAPSPSTSQVRQIWVYTRQNQDVKVKKIYLDDWISQILEKYKNRSIGIRVQERRPMGCYQALPPQKIPLQCNGSSLALPGRICGRECKMIIDTDSSHTVVRPNIVAHCRMQDTEEKYRARCEVIPVKGVHLAEIKIGNKTFKQKGFVADITDDVLLGLDIMSKDFILDLPKRVMIIDDEEVPLNGLKTQAAFTRRVKIVCHIAS
ncbi:hypothetical protein NQ315_014534 [Exocentrus adspersus]|uniref:Uncharacterized protein n=1 Tax=Exocentrus adspersus TaxID=1586481 RepID=A0AAV8VKA3_9CUCU|nr:hypothetical protein NQ315_014534 [Exocentrus adspersus]